MWKDNNLWIVQGPLYNLVQPSYIWSNFSQLNTFHFYSLQICDPLRENESDVAQCIIK